MGYELQDVDEGSGAKVDESPVEQEAEEEEYLSWEDRQRQEQREAIKNIGYDLNADTVDEAGNNQIPQEDNQSLFQQLAEERNLVIQDLLSLENKYPSSIEIRQNLENLFSAPGDANELYTDVEKLRVRAAEIKNLVSESAGTDSIKPAEAFAELLDYAWQLSDKDLDKFMWLTTNVVLGVNAYEHPNVWGVGLVGVEYEGTAPFEDYAANKNPYFVGSLLPFQESEQSNLSRIGDWSPELFDGTANQAFHFWNYAAITFYNGEFLAWVGDKVHDPVYLTPETREWLQENVSFIAKLTGQTSEEDANLSAAAIRFGNLVKAYAL